MNRKLATRIIATGFMIFGLWNIGIFFWLPLSQHSKNELSLFSIIIGIIFFRAGDNLFKLSTFGRKFALVLLSIYGLWNAYLLILFVFFSENKVLFSSVFWGQLSFNPGNNYFVNFSITFMQTLAILSMMAFLLHEETKKIFRPEKKQCKHRRFC